MTNLTDLTKSDAFDIARSLRFHAEVLHREAAALDSTASFIETRYGLTSPDPVR